MALHVEPQCLDRGCGLEVVRNVPSSPCEKRRERHEASEEPRNVRAYMSSEERRFVARSNFSDGLGLHIPGRQLAFGGPFVIQWHLTDQCNLRCKHCYRSGPPRPSLPLSRVEEIFDELSRFLRKRNLHARFHFAGGEPTLSPLLLPLMRRAHVLGFSSRVLTNGTMIDPSMAKELCAAGCVGVQISVEGPEDIHDEIRGPGSFRQAIHAAQVLQDAAVPATLAMTLHSDNVSSMNDVCAIAKSVATRVYFSRLVPVGEARTRLRPIHTSEWFSAMTRATAMAAGFPVAMRDPTFRPFFASRHNACRAPAIAGCAAGFYTLTIESDGTIMPCRRLDLPIGRFGHDSLEDVWQQSPVLQSLRDRDSLGGACGRCSYRWVCGGCRAIARAITGHWLDADPQCPWSGIRAVRAEGRHVIDALRFRWASRAPLRFI